MKQIAQHAFLQALAAIDIPAAIDKSLARTGSRIQFLNEEIDLQSFDSILAIAYGKASVAMARGLTDALAPEYQPEGILVVPSAVSKILDPAQIEFPGWEIFLGGHPTPNAASFEAGRAILSRLDLCEDRTLIFFLLSGGGSSLVEQSLVPGLSHEDFRELHSVLVTCGAPIKEINAVRKHLSATKGGRLAAAAPHSLKLTMAISDVPHAQQDAIASGPTLPDPTTSSDACEVAQEYKLIERFPAPLRTMFESRNLPETPKASDPAFARNHFCLLLGEHDLMHAAHRACEAHGFLCIGDATTDDWPVERAADHLLALLQKQLDERTDENARRPVAVLATGEVSSPVTGNGTGGRNSAFVLACVPKIAGKQITVMSAGTDGIDGNSLAAGAIADGETLARAQSAGLDVSDYFARSDAHSFFASLDDAIVTGPTGNNLRDLRILLAR